MDFGVLVMEGTLPLAAADAFCARRWVRFLTRALAIVRQPRLKLQKVEEGKFSKLEWLDRSPSFFCLQKIQEEQRGSTMMRMRTHSKLFRDLDRRNFFDLDDNRKDACYEEAQGWPRGTSTCRRQ